MTKARDSFPVNYHQNQGPRQKFTFLTGTWAARDDKRCIIAALEHLLLLRSSRRLIYAQSHRDLHPCE